MIVNPRPAEVITVCARISQDPDKIQQAFLAISCADLSRDALYAKFANLPKEVQPACFAELQRIAASTD